MFRNKIKSVSKLPTNEERYFGNKSKECHPDLKFILRDFILLHNMLFFVRVSFKMSGIFN